MSLHKSAGALDQLLELERAAESARSDGDLALGAIFLCVQPPNLMTLAAYSYFIEDVDDHFKLYSVRRRQLFRV